MRHRAHLAVAGADPRFRWSAVLGALVLGAAPAFPAVAQTPGDTAAPAPSAERVRPIATVRIWSEGIWIGLLDREGSWYGAHAEEGVFQRFNDLADDEYELDLRTALFTGTEDAVWARGGDGLRLAGASVSHAYAVHLLDWRQDFRLAGPVDVLARYRREQSFTAERDYPRVGVAWRDVLGSPWTVGTLVGVHFFKPAIDVELNVSRHWGGEGEARWDLELGGAALNTFNDFIFKRLGVREEEVATQVDQGTEPYAARLGLRRISGRSLFEVEAGATNRSDLDATLADGTSFEQEEQVVFAGATLQVDPTPWWSAAVSGTLARADTERRTAPADSGGFDLREETTTVGVRQRFRMPWTLALEVELLRTDRPERRTRDRGPDVDHRDREVFGQVALLRSPDAGWTGRLAWASLDREPGVLAPELAAHNRRLLTALGYRFASGFEITAGVGWDIDAFDTRRFDGGHLRFSGRW